MDDFLDLRISLLSGSSIRTQSNMEGNMTKRFQIYSIIEVSSSIISVMGCLTLLFMIGRSHQKLKVPLNRLFLGLCLCDFIAASARSFGMIPSPLGQAPSWTIWNTVNGTMTLCRVQGFLILLGQIASALYHCSICVYYLIEIKYTNVLVRMKRMEYLLHAIPILFSLSLDGAILGVDGIHPSATTCYPVLYNPFECRFDATMECDFNVELSACMKILFLLWLVIMPSVTYGCMMLIYRRVSSQEELTNRFRFSFSERASFSANRNTLAARNRCIAYGLLWVLTWGPTLCLLVNFISNHGRPRFHSDYKEGGTEDDESRELAHPFLLGIMYFLLNPLQGLFTFLLYIVPRLSRQLRRYKRRGLPFPKRFFKAFFTSIMSRGERELRPRRSQELHHRQSRGSIMTSTTTTSSGITNTTPWRRRPS